MTFSGACTCQTALEMMARCDIVGRGGDNFSLDINTFVGAAPYYTNRRTPYCLP